MAVLSGLFLCGDNDSIYGGSSSARKLGEHDDYDALADVFPCSNNNFLPSEICAIDKNLLKTSQSVNDSATATIQPPLRYGCSDLLMISKMHLNQCMDYICLVTSAMLSFVLSGWCKSSIINQFGLLAVFVVLLNGLATAAFAANVGDVNTRSPIRTMSKKCKFSILKPNFSLICLFLNLIDHI